MFLKVWTPYQLVSAGSVCSFVDPLPVELLSVQVYIELDAIGADKAEAKARRILAVSATRVEWWNVDTLGWGRIVLIVEVAMVLFQRLKCHDARDVCVAVHETEKSCESHGSKPHLPGD